MVVVNCRGISAIEPSTFWLRPLKIMSIWSTALRFLSKTIKATLNPKLNITNEADNKYGLTLDLNS